MHTLKRGRRLRFTTEVPFWFGSLRRQQPQFPAPEGPFRGRDPTITDLLLKDQG
jgi:hypothetical protein